MYQAQLVSNNESPSYYTIVFRDTANDSRIVINLLKGQTAVVSSGSYFEFQGQKFAIKLLINENRVIIEDNRHAMINILVNNISQLQNDITMLINGV